VNAATIKVRIAEHALHCWPNAPEHRAYLRNPHRHLFNIEAECEVTNDWREVEFHNLQESVRQRFCLLRDTGGLKELSCEGMARHLGAALADLYRRRFTVSVWEDWECCGTVVTEPQKESAPGGRLLVVPAEVTS
jgi:hypothetical protein